MAEKRDYYEVLGLKKGASEDEIKGFQKDGDEISSRQEPLETRLQKKNLKR